MKTIGEIAQVQDVAIRCIQRNVRKLQAIQVWPWWRLMLRLSPLLNVHRTEEELKARTVIFLLLLLLLLLLLGPNAISTRHLNQHFFFLFFSFLVWL